MLDNHPRPVEVCDGAGIVSDAGGLLPCPRPAEIGLAPESLKDAAARLRLHDYRLVKAFCWPMYAFSNEEVERCNYVQPTLFKIEVKISLRRGSADKKRFQW